MKLQITCLTLLLISRTALGAPADDYFIEGAFGLAWGTKLEAVQQKYPHGYTWETSTIRGTDFGYEVDIATSLFGLDEPSLHVHFYFNEHEQLNAMLLHYRYDRRELVLYQIAETLGQDYMTRNDKHQQIFQWKSQSKILVSLTIGNVSQFNWVNLHIDADKLVDR